MNFFCTEKHVEEWLSKKELSKSTFYSLNIADALVVAKRIFKKIY